MLSKNHLKHFRKPCTLMIYHIIHHILNNQLAIPQTPITSWYDYLPKPTFSFSSGFLLMPRPRWGFFLPSGVSILCSWAMQTCTHFYPQHTSQSCSLSWLIDRSIHTNNHIAWSNLYISQIIYYKCVNCCCTSIDMILMRGKQTPTSMISPI